MTMNIPNESHNQNSQLYQSDSQNRIHGYFSKRLPKNIITSPRNQLSSQSNNFATLQ